MENKYDHLTRQIDLIPVDTLGLRVNIIGCGAIGSFTALALAKMGLYNIQVWDHDEVSIENMSNQFFRFKDIGTNKATALAALVEDFTGVKIKAHAARFEDKDILGLQDLVISAVDSMAVRTMVFDELQRKMNTVRALIDARMSAETLALYTVAMNKQDQKDNYRASLYTDSEAVQEQCTAKSTVYTATLAAGMVTKSVKNILLKQDFPKTADWNIASSECNNKGMSLVMYPGNF